MGDKDLMDQEEIYSKVLRAGRRTYFFDVRSTKAGDYYLTITESKKFTHDDGSFHYKKHKIYLYKEDFTAFREIMEEMMDYIIDEKGLEVISEIKKTTMRQIITILIFATTCIASAQNDVTLDYYLPQDISYDQSIPKPSDIIGHEVGEWHVRNAYCSLPRFFHSW